MTHSRISTPNASTTPSSAVDIGHGAVGGLRAGLGALLRHMLRTRRNRRAIAQLMALDELALRDIGLSRSDVAGALALPLSCDPSLHLAASLAERRRQSRLRRLRG